MAVTTGTINTAHRGEVLIQTQRLHRVRRLRAGVGAVPLVSRDDLHSVRGITKHRILQCDLTVCDLKNLVVDGLHRLNETVEFLLRLRLGRLHHQGARNRERQGGGMETEVHQALTHVLSGHMRTVGQLTHIQDALVTHQPARAGVQYGELIVQFLRHIVGVQYRICGRALQTLSAAHRDIHPADRQHPGRSEERLRNRKRRAFRQVTFSVSGVGITGQVLHQVLPHRQGAHAGAAAAVRNGEGLVQVQVGDVAAELTGLRKAHLRIQVSAIHIHLPARSVHQLAHLGHLLLKHAVRGGVGDHNACDRIAVLLNLCLQILNIDRAVGCGCHTRNLKPSQCGGCGIRAVCRERNEHSIALMVTISLVVGADGTQTGVLA